MTQSSGRRLATALVLVLLLSALLVPSASAGCHVVHIVRPGETLAGISARYGVNMYTVAAANHIENLNVIFVGQRLIIPQRCAPPSPPPPPPPPANPWTATYWNNTGMSGAPALQQPVPWVNFNWGLGSPAPQVQPDYFSAVYVRSWFVGGGYYRMYARSDDGIRIYMDGGMLVDDWSVHPVRAYVKDLYIPRGYHTFMVLYFEETGVAEVGIDFQRL